MCISFPDLLKTGTVWHKLPNEIAANQLHPQVNFPALFHKVLQPRLMLDGKMATLEHPLKFPLQAFLWKFSLAKIKLGAGRCYSVL